MKSYKGPGIQWVDNHHTGIKTPEVQIDDGRWHHRLGASWLKTTDICLDRARREHVGGDTWEDFESDAASIGTCSHTAIEMCVAELNDYGMALDLADMKEVFNQAFSKQMSLPNFRFVNYDEASARLMGEVCLYHWYQGVLPTLPEKSLQEVKFVLPFVENERHVIELSGAIDYLADRALKDWKTAGRGPYTEWEYKRWAIAPTVYTWAAHELGLVDEVPWPDYDREEDSVPFEYVVMHEKGHQRFTVYRGHDDWSWLMEKASKIATRIEHDLPEWPVNDNQALCSAKWCPAWNDCKGKHGIEF